MAKVKVHLKAIIDPGVWHDWWNASDRHDARVRPVTVLSC
jgi:hypothetical protein